MGLSLWPPQARSGCATRVAITSMSSPKECVDIQKSPTTRHMDLNLTIAHHCTGHMVGYALNKTLLGSGGVSHHVAV